MTRTGLFSDVTPKLNELREQATEISGEEQFRQRELHVQSKKAGGKGSGIEMHIYS